MCLLEVSDSIHDEMSLLVNLFLHAQMPNLKFTHITVSRMASSSARAWRGIHYNNDDTVTNGEINTDAAMQSHGPELL